MFHVKHIKGDIQMNEAKTLVIRGNLVDIINRRTFGAEISILNGHIGKVIPTGQDEGSYLLPGFIDAHVHIESSMVTPAAFIHAAVRHGSIGAVADPHEIANVMGTEGVEYMLDNAKGIPSTHGSVSHLAYRLRLWNLRCDHRRRRNRSFVGTRGSTLLGRDDELPRSLK